MDGILSQYRKQCFGTNKIFICVGQLKNQLLQKNSIFCWYVESSSKLDFSPELAFLMGGEGGRGQLRVVKTLSVGCQVKGLEELTPWSA